MVEMPNPVPARWTVAILAVALSGTPALAAQVHTSAPPPTQQSQAAAQTPPPATDPQQAPPKPDPPAEPSQNLDRIRLALSREPKITLDEGQIRFYVEVLAKLPRIEEIIGKYDLMHGPTRGGAPMTHNEFLSMVTPRELYGSAGIKPVELLQFALTSWLGKAFVKKVVEDLRNASSEREIQAIRDRIDRELAAIKRKGG